MTDHAEARDWLAAELRRHGLAPAVVRAVLGGADTYAARASASAVAAERERVIAVARQLRAVYPVVLDPPPGSERATTRTSFPFADYLEDVAP